MHEQSALGRIEVLPSAIATVVARALTQCYGVVGLAPHRMTDAVANFFAPDARRSIQIRERPEGLVIDVYLILAHGVRLIAVRPQRPAGHQISGGAHRRAAGRRGERPHPGPASTALLPPGEGMRERFPMSGWKRQEA